MCLNAVSHGPRFFFFPFLCSLTVGFWEGIVGSCYGYTLLFCWPLFLFFSLSHFFCQFCCTCVEPWRARLIPASDLSCLVFYTPFWCVAVYSSGGARRKSLVSAESRELLLFFPNSIFFLIWSERLCSYFFPVYLWCSCSFSCKIKWEEKKALRITHCAHRSRKIMCVMFHCSLSPFSSILFFSPEDG